MSQVVLYFVIMHRIFLFQKYICWKQHMTTLQMVQFVGIMVHGFQLVFYKDCDFPNAFAYYIAAHAVMFFILFSQFYIKSYLTKRPTAKDIGKSNGLAKSYNLKNLNTKKID
jgi:elongation of very long chain fatty acids protein 7